ncbi:MAG: ADP-ribosylglycohydrolase family protein [Desulfobacterales bacterium]
MFSRGLWQRHTAYRLRPQDENHIGGLALYLPVLIVFSKDRDHARKTALQHLALTHGGPAMARGGALIADILLDVLYGRSLPDAILSRDVYNQQLASLLDFPDPVVVGRHFSPACYLQESIPATLYLALKYADNPSEALDCQPWRGDNAAGALCWRTSEGVHGMAAWPKNGFRGWLIRRPRRFCNQELKKRETYPHRFSIHRPENDPQNR